jgi:hypothetical protein
MYSLAPCALHHHTRSLAGLRNNTLAVQGGGSMTGSSKAVKQSTRHIAVEQVTPAVVAAPAAAAAVAVAPGRLMEPGRDSWPSGYYRPTVRMLTSMFCYHPCICCCTLICVLRQCLLAPANSMYMLWLAAAVLH